MTNSDAKKKEQLGIPFGTANGQLKKEVLFYFVKQAKAHYCFRCQKEIITIKEFSIEHKVPWQDSQTPKELFFDMENIAFSHIACNIGAGRRFYNTHGAVKKYEAGCRCKLCTAAQREKVRKYRAKKKNQK